MKASHQRILLDLLALPTSPFNEQWVAGYIRRWASSRPGVVIEEDAFGNLLLRVRRGKAGGPPLVLVAHMDHPGFEAERMIGRKRLRAHWRGGVAPEYFVGTGVRFFSEGNWVRGRVRSIQTFTDHGRRRVRTAEIVVSGAVSPGSIGMWDLPDPVIRGDRLYARGCDDVAGLGAVLCALDDLSRGRGSVDLSALCSRAEEVGFVGAMAAARDGLVPSGAHVVSIETSSEIPGVRMGDGPILRVGDWASIFSPGLTSFCRAVGADLARKNKTFRFQRKLMDGGTCEASAFCGRGFEATGICVALGNYHNMNRRRERIASEYIDVRDLACMIEWFKALATTDRKPGCDDPGLQKMLTRLEQQWTPLLRRSAARVRAGRDAGA